MTLRWVGIALLTGLVSFASGGAAYAQTADDYALEKRITELQKSGNGTQALAIAKSALEEAERTLVAEHQSVGIRLFLLGLVHQAQGRGADAEPLYNRSLLIVEKALGANHKTVGSILVRLADLYWSQDRLADAEPLYRRALSIREATLGPDSPDTATILNMLAEACRLQNRAAEALPLQERALSIREKALGPDHRAVAVSLNNLALIHVAEKRFEAAEPIYKRALAINERSWGPEHRETGTVLANLAELYQKLGRNEDAETFFVRALSVREKALGPNHRDVGITLTNLALLYESQGKYVDAEPLLKRSLAINEKLLGPDHAEVGNSLNTLGLLYESLGKFADAEPLLKRSLTIYENVLGPDHPDVGNSLNTLGSLYESLGKFADAEPVLKRSLAINEKALGPDHNQVGASLNSLAVLYKSLGRYAEAEPLYKRSLLVVEKALGPDHPDVGATLENLASLYSVQTRYAEAEPLLKRSLAIQERALGPNHRDVGRSLINLALLYSIRTRYADAEPLSERALSIFEKALGPDHPDVGRSLSNLAGLHQSQGRYAHAEPLLKRSLAIHEKTSGPDHPDVSIALNDLAELYWHQGRYAEAESLLKRSLAIREKAFTPDHPLVGESLNNLAELNKEQGRYAEAETLHRRALTVREKALGPDHPDVSGSLNNLAGVYQSQRRYAEAEPLLKRSLAIREKALGPNARSIGDALNNLGTLYLDQDRYADAKPPLERTLAIFEKTLGPDHPDVGTVLSHLAQTYDLERRYVDAESLLKRALAIHERALGPDHPSVAKGLTNLAVFYFAQGRYAEAEPLFKRALAIRETALGADHPDVGKSFSNFGALYFAQRDWVKAEGYFRKSADLAIRRTRRGTEEATGRPVAGKARSEAEGNRLEFQGILTAAYRMENDQSKPPPGHSTFVTAQWALASEAATSLTQMAARLAKGDGAMAGLIRERQDLVAEWQGKDKLFIAARSEAPNKRDPAAEQALGERLSAIDTRIGEIDKTIIKDFPEYAALANPEPLSIEEVQAQLGPNEALLLFLDTPGLGSVSEETFIWAVTKTDSRWVRSKFGTGAHNERVKRLRCGLDSSNWIDTAQWSTATEDGKRRKAVQDARREWCREHMGMEVKATALLPFDLKRSHELYQALFGQIEDLIKDKSLLIVPSGPLAQIPFHVLVTEQPGTAIPRNVSGYAQAKWLGAQHPIMVLPSVASLKSLRKFARTSAASSPYIGFGNPILDGSPSNSMQADRAVAARKKQSCPPSVRATKPITIAGFEVPTALPSLFIRGIGDVAALRRQPPLPETADELCAVARQLGAQETDVYLGARATETAIKKLSTDGVLASHRILHFATHGLIAGETELFAKSLAEPALLLTPPETASEEDDGLLTASEVAQLNLDADWVLLSACNTAASGEKGNAEALSGLARAFFYARARSLLVSHWYVDSNATVALVTKSLAELAANPAIGRSEALRRAMVALISKGGNDTHPAHWAPFVVVGEGGASEPGINSTATIGARAVSPVPPSASGLAGPARSVEVELGQPKVKEKRASRRPKPAGEWDWLWGE